jgi:hypothetical protein
LENNSCGPQDRKIKADCPLNISLCVIHFLSEGRQLPSMKNRTDGPVLPYEAVTKISIAENFDVTRTAYCLGKEDSDCEAPRFFQ